MLLDWIKSSLELYSEVTLTQDIDEYNIQAGDITTLIDFVTHPQGKEDGCILEVFNAVGESIADTVGESNQKRFKRNI
jgi:hypothetical protein